MAERRMFAKTIIDSDAFLELPMTAQLLYFHLSMRADDDGFVNKPRSIMKLVGAKDADMISLRQAKFIIIFESGIVVIKHWRIHNYIAKDRYNETQYKFEKAQLYLDEHKCYSESPQETAIQEPVYNPSTTCIQPVDTGKVSIGKDSIGKVNTPPISPSSYFADRPTLDEAVKNWIDYKDEKKQRLGTNGINALCKEVSEKADEFGDDAVSNCINVTMSSGYSRIAWDLLVGRNQPVKKQKVYTQAERDEFNATILEFMKGDGNELG